LQCRPDEDPDARSGARIRDELQIRLGVQGWTLADEPNLEKGVTPMRSVVAAYSDVPQRRVWRAQDFPDDMASMMHTYLDSSTISGNRRDVVTS
jgi:hypothetical protein